MKIKTHILKNWILSSTGKNLCLVLLFVVQLFSSQIVVKDNSLFVGSENVVSEDSFSSSETVVDNAVLYVSSGTTVTNIENIVSYKTIAIKKSKPSLEVKTKGLAQVSKRHKLPKNDTSKRIKTNPEKPQEFYSSSPIDSQISIHNQIVSFAIPAQVGKDRTLVHTFVFAWKPLALKRISEKLDSFQDDILARISLGTLSIRPPPFLA